MVDFNALLLDPTYNTFGVPAKIRTPAGDEVTVTALDETDGVPVSVGNIGVQTVKPAASVRMKELATNKLTPAEIDEGQITLNNQTWRIRSWVPKPTAKGEADGEALFLLEDDRLDK